MSEGGPRCVDLVIAKLGGAAITVKHQEETLRPDVLARCARHFSLLLAEQPATRLLLVHGAGSFGHIQAARARVQEGRIHSHPAVKQAFLRTRLSVTRLNHAVVSALVEEGVPAVGVSLCGHWLTTHREVSVGCVAEIRRLLQAGLVPVLHGDAVMDDGLGCTILGGDTIIRHLAAELRPNYVVFLTNVPGVYDQPPENAGANLIRRLLVDSDGGLVKYDGRNCLEFASSAHDTTGGIQAKVSEAARIAAMGIDVLIAEAGTCFGLLACKRGPGIEAEWIGTHVSLAINST